MNNQRRKEIQTVIDTIATLRNQYDNCELEFVESLDGLYSDIEQVKYDEEEYRDNMPENLQESERYQVADENVYDLEEATSTIEGIKDEVRDAIEKLAEVVDKLEESISR